jgi:hypothetical protein
LIEAVSLSAIAALVGCENARVTHLFQVSYNVG